MNGIDLFQLVKETVTEFRKDHASVMAAALSYYMIFALPALLLVLLSILNIFIQNSQSSALVAYQASIIFGKPFAATLKTILENLTAHTEQSRFAQWVGIITLFVATTSVIGHLQTSLSRIWKTIPVRQSLWFFIRQRLISLVFLSIIAALLFVSVIMQPVLTVVRSSIPQLWGLSPVALQLINGLFAFAGMTIFIALIYTLLPSGHLSAKDITVGALVTAILVSIGNYLIGIYLSSNALGSAYGAAGSILVFIVWIYYSALIFFFGAEFTQVYAKTHGKGIRS